MSNYCILLWSNVFFFPLIHGLIINSISWWFSFAPYCLPWPWSVSPVFPSPYLFLSPFICCWVVHLNGFCKSLVIFPCKLNSKFGWFLSFEIRFEINISSLQYHVNSEFGSLNLPTHRSCDIHSLYLSLPAHASIMLWLNLERWWIAEILRPLAGSNQSSFSWSGY